MRINTNISSLQSQRQLSSIAKAISTSLARLSSGKRINSAKDGAAELAISTGLEAQQRGLRQAIRNINDAKGYTQTLSGVISTQTGIVQRMKELAIQSANGILSSEQRSYLETEFQSLYSEFNRLSAQSEFNGEKIADGSFVTKKIQAGTKKGETIDLGLPSLLAKDIFVETRGSGAFNSNYFRGANAAGLLWNNPGDINNDGIIDFAGGSGASTYISLGQADGSFSASSTAFTVTGAVGNWATIDDINNDGKADIIETTNSSGYIITALGNGNGTFQTAKTIASAAGNQREVKVGDLDGDGYKDLVVADYTSSATTSIYYGRGDGTFEARTTLANVAATNSYGIELVDINEDGRLDIMSGSQTAGSVFLNQGSRSFSSTAIPFASTFMDFADLNGDGHKDMLYSAATAAYFGVAFGNGNGTFQTPTTYGITGSNTYQVILADLNGDTYLDATIADNVSSLVYYSFGKANGTFSTVRTLAAEPGTNVMVNDINEDGAPDIITSGTTNWRTNFGVPQDTSALEKMTITTQDDASDVLAILDNALERLSSANASLGSISNRLDSAESVSLNLSESLAQAKSQIQDTDYAEEMAEYTRLQILQSAALAVMNQNQMNMKLVLKLLT